MIDELNAAIRSYQEKWQALVGKRQNKAFFAALRPTSVAWKTEDLTDFDERFAELRDHADQIHLGWVNDRWLATIRLRDTTLESGLTIIKLMQRRPGSTDAVGLDHLDFYFDPETLDGSAKDVLSGESDLKWNEEINGEHCKWLSVWFEGTEAKIRSDTVIDVCIAEMNDIRSQIMAENS